MATNKFKTYKIKITINKTSFIRNNTYYTLTRCVLFFLKYFLWLFDVSYVRKMDTYSEIKRWQYLINLILYLV